MSRLGKTNVFKSETRKIKAFFKRQKWKEVFTFMFFLCLSLGFWYLQTLQDEYEIEIVIPVKYKNIPADKVLTGNNPKKIAVKVRDRGTILINYSWFRTFAPIEVNVKELQRGAKNRMNVSQKIIEANISKQLIASTSLISIEPSSIQVEYDDLLNKKIPVVADVSVTTEAGFQVSDKLSVTPSEVRVYAGRAVLDSLSAVRTIALRLEEINETKTYKLSLQKIDGVRYEPQEVNVKIPVEEYTEKRLNLSIQCDSLPDNYVLHVFPATVEVLCNLPLSRFKELSETDFEISLPFEEFKKNRDVGKVPIRLTKQPDWLSGAILKPEVVEYILEQK